MGLGCHDLLFLPKAAFCHAKTYHPNSLYVFPASSRKWRLQRTQRLCGSELLCGLDSNEVCTLPILDKRMGGGLTARELVY